MISTSTNNFNHDHRMSPSSLSIKHSTPIKQLSGSALSALVSMDPIWKGQGEEDDDDDEPLVMPDFHYNWLSEEEQAAGRAKQSSTSPGSEGVGSVGSFTAASASSRTASGKGLTSLQSLGRPSGPPRSYSNTSVSEHAAQNTPPQYGHRHPGSAQSSGSSARVVSLTDASTASASSMVPTPPYTASHLSRASLSSHGSGGSGSGGSGDRPLGRTYSSRPFQRHVSAPIGRDRVPGEEITKDNDDFSLSTTTGHTHTVTARPALTQTTSASSVHELKESTNRASASARTFVTPGMKDRTYAPGTAGSTTRRLGGLSRFGGPARRVTQAEADALAEAEARNSPVLMPSPPRSATQEDRDDLPPEVPRAGPSTQPAQSPPRDHGAAARRRSPPMSRRHLATAPAIPEIVEYLDAEPDHRQRSTSPAIMEARQEEPRARQPLRAYHSENIPSSSHTRSESKIDRSDHQPPQAARRPPESPPQLQHRTTPPRRLEHEYRPAPSAPTPVPLHTEVRSQTQTAPLPMTSSEPSRQAPPPPAPVPPPDAALNNKRMFAVNGAYYERVGMLGKGGSSKVYSVLCPTKRTIFALKRVTLDRADHETYQSYTNEIELLKRLRGHDRIIQLVDYQITFSANNRPKTLVMIMECGEIDFAMLLDEQRGKPLNFNFVGLYWQQMLEAVQAVHLENVVHTDLKPANFVLVKGRLKIIDFGIAKAIANDTVNIQRDQQIGTVNYMSPEAINKMTNLNVLKLSYPSDVWSLGCILYQMVYGSPPFQHIPGGPLSKMQVIADPNHRVEYPDTAIPRGATGAHGEAVDPATLAVKVMPSAIDTMRSCLAYSKEQRLTIPALLEHEFLRPRLDKPTLPRDTTTISSTQMRIMVDYVLRKGKCQVDMSDAQVEDLFAQLVAQNEQD